jgi:hypothetical protein
MTVTVKDEDDKDIIKEVRRGGAVKFTVDGTRMTLWVKVVEIKEETKSLVVDYLGENQEVAAHGILDCMSRQEYEFQKIQDRVDNA